MKKTNIRVRRNGGSKPASPQVPNKPESRQTTAPRFEGVVKWISDETGLISFSPDGKPSEAVFRVNELSVWGERDLRAGGKVSFRLALNERGHLAVDVQAITLAPELPPDGWKPLSMEIFQTAIELHETKRGDSLCRNKTGRLYVSRKIRNTANRVLGTEYREVAFTQACDWLVNQGLEMNPEVFLARHGILEQARLSRRDENITALNVDAAVDSAFALIELLEYPLTVEDEGQRPDGRRQAFTNGIINLTATVQDQLLKFKDDFRAAMKAGAQ